MTTQWQRIGSKSITASRGHPHDVSEIYGRRLEVLIHNGNYLAAHRVIDEAEAAATGDLEELTPDTPLSATELGRIPRLLHLLERRYRNVGELARATRDELLRIRNIGDRQAEQALEIATGFAERMENDDS